MLNLHKLDHDTSNLYGATLIKFDVHNPVHQPCVSSSTEKMKDYFINHYFSSKEEYYSIKKEYIHNMSLILDKNIIYDIFEYLKNTESNCVRFGISGCGLVINIINKSNDSIKMNIHTELAICVKNIYVQSIINDILLYIKYYQETNDINGLLYSQYMIVKCAKFLYSEHIQMLIENINKLSKNDTENAEKMMYTLVNSFLL